MKVKILSDFFWKRFIAKLEVSYWYGYMISWPFLTPRKTRMHMNLNHVVSGHFVLGRGVLCECADYWPLAVKYASNKAMPAGKAAIPVRWKTCECCDHVFQSKQKVECNLWEKAMKHDNSSSVKSVSSRPTPTGESNKLVQLGLGTSNRQLSSPGSHSYICTENLPTLRVMSSTG